VMNIPGFFPRPALNTEATGLPRGLIFELVLKRAFLEGITTVQRLVNEIKLDYGIVQEVYHELRQEELCDPRGNYEFALTAKGRRRAEEAYRKNQYAGPAPVPLAAYCHAVCEQAFQPRVTRDSLAEILFDLVVTEEIIRDLGSAIMTGGTIFLYGPSGNGKTSIAERLHRIFDDLVYIPHAVEVSSQILTVYDPNVHRSVEQPHDIDRRWVLCQRPFLAVGGEMQASMLEARMDELTRISVAPLQMKANNGILMIDDFGRQQMQPRELLNRWIQPLDRRIDYLSLWSGVKFEIPFDVLVVFATNLEPAHLAEDAFMRRIKNKIKIGAVSAETLVRIWERLCKEKGIEFSQEVAEYACRRCAEHNPEGLRACFPRDLLDIVCGVAAFEQRSPVLTRDEVDRAAQLYFTR
ncbi:MAG: AAA family ATPase, partial [Acidobacteria bacterium]|nr:AAA family ATPase [Acidobacteriota bacterium]